MSEFDDVRNVYLGWINSILRKVTGCASKDISSFSDLSNGKALAQVCTALNLPLKSFGEDIFNELLQFFGNAKIDCKFEAVSAAEGDEATLLDITWSLILHFSVCRGQDIDPDDKCIELGRCLLIEWLQIVCPSVGVLDADKELSVYFLGNDLLVKVVESVFSTKLTLPAGNLSKQIFCTLLLVEEAFGVSKSIVDAKGLAEGNCPEFALIVYLSLLKSFYLGDFNQSHNSSHVSEVFHRPSLNHSVIHEQPSQEDIEESLSSSSGVGTCCTDKIDDCDKMNENFNVQILQQYHNPSNQESGIQSSSNCNSQLDEKNLETCNFSLKLTSKFGQSSTEYHDNNFACSTPRFLSEKKSTADGGIQNRDGIVDSSSNKFSDPAFLRSGKEVESSSNEIVLTDNSPCQFNGQNLPASDAPPSSFADVSFQDNLKPHSIVNMNDTKSSTILQVTVIEQNKDENSSIDTVRLREILDRTELGSSQKEDTAKEISIASNHTNQSQTSVENSFLERDIRKTMESTTDFQQQEANLIFRPVEGILQFSESNQVSGNSDSFKKVLSPPQDPLMRLLENIADKGQCLRDALDLSQNQLDSGTHSSHNNSLNFGNELWCAPNPSVLELEKKVDDLSERNYTLSLQLKEMTRKLDHELLKSARLVKELDRLEMINRSFREENLKQEEKIIFLEDTLLQKDSDAMNERIELRAQKEAIEKKLNLLPLTENLIEVDEKDAAIIGLQHEVEEINFEKQKVERELEHARELMKQKELRQLKEETEREAEMKKMKNKNSTDAMSVDRFAEMSSTICNLENALSTSEKRNNELSHKLDNLTFNQTSNYYSESLNRSFQPAEQNSHEPDLNLSCPCIFYSRDWVSESSFRPPPVFVNEYSMSPSSYKFDPLPLFIPQRTPPVIPQFNSTHLVNLSCPSGAPGSGGQNSCRLSNKAVFSSHAIKNQTSEIGLQTPTISSEMSSLCQNCQHSMSVKPNLSSIGLAPHQNQQISAFGDVPSVILEPKKTDSAYLQTSNFVPTVSFSKNVASNETQTSKTGLSQSSRELIDEILAKYSSSGTKIFQESQKNIQVSMLPSTDRSTSSQVLSSDAVVVSKPYKSSEISSNQNGNTVRDVNYSSLREATQTITKQILASDNGTENSTENKNVGSASGNESNTPAIIKTFDEFLQSKQFLKSEIFSGSGSTSAEANLKPFLSRTLASNDVFFHDGNTDLKNKHILSSVQTPEAKGLPSNLSLGEMYRSPITAGVEVNEPSAQKFSALFSNVNSDSGIISTFDAPKESCLSTKDFDATSVITEMGHRLKNGLKIADNVSSPDTAISGAMRSNSSAFGAQNQIPGFMTNESAVRYVPQSRISNIEDEIITRYKKELRLVGIDEDLSETVTQDIHANIMNNLRNRKSVKGNSSFSSSDITKQESCYDLREGIQKGVLTAEKPGNLAKNTSYSHPNAANYDTANSEFSSPRDLAGETPQVKATPSSNAAWSVGNYLKTLDDKYGAVNQNIIMPILEKSSRAKETKAKENFMRSSTPTKHMHNVPDTLMTHPPPPAIDVSHISLAAALTNPISSRPMADHSVNNQHHAVQFYQVRNFQDVSSMTGSSGFTH